MIKLIMGYVILDDTIDSTRFINYIYTIIQYSRSTLTILTWKGTTRTLCILSEILLVKFYESEI